MKSGENKSSCFKEEAVRSLHDFIHVYQPETRVDNAEDKSLILTKRVPTFVIHCKF